MRLSDKEYKEAVGYLRRFNSNCVEILVQRGDIMTIGSPKYDGMPKPPYSISDPVSNTVIKLEENPILNRAIHEWQVVRQALDMTDKMTHDIFREEFELNERNRWNIIETLHISEDQYKRRRKKLIYLVHENINKK